VYSIVVRSTLSVSVCVGVRVCVRVGEGASVRVY